MISYIDQHKRSCERYLANTFGFAPSSERFFSFEREVNTHAFANDEDRRKAWLAESLHSALVYLEKGGAGDAVMMLRCTLQASELCGRLGGYWPTPLGDVYSFLRNELEDRIKGV